MSSLRLIRFTVILPFLLSFIVANAQDPHRFDNEIAQIRLKDYQVTKGEKVVVFTGSSSIRMWTDVQKYFPDVVAINTGFGGSHMSDLLYFANETIIKFRPSEVFIYEGDNDLDAKKTPEAILATTKQLIDKLRDKLPDLQIVLISAKPSLARWKLKNSFIRLNQLFRDYCNGQPDVRFANIWDSMLGTDGTPRKDIFLEDGLHMNKTGYGLWFNVLKAYIN